MSGGYWSVQINDTDAVNGTFSTSPKTINGGGLLLLGQYQHAVGGGFDPSEAFVGEIFRLVGFAVYTLWGAVHNIT